MDRAREAPRQQRTSPVTMQRELERRERQQALALGRASGQLTILEHAMARISNAPELTLAGARETARLALCAAELARTRGSTTDPESSIRELAERHG